MSEHKKPDPEIEKIYREEVRRRPTDEELKAQSKRFERDFYQLLKEGDEERLRSVLIAYGFREGEERFEKALKLWREYQKQRGGRKR